MVEMIAITKKISWIYDEIAKVEKELDITIDYELLIHEVIWCVVTQRSYRKHWWYFFSVNKKNEAGEEDSKRHGDCCGIVYSLFFRIITHFRDKYFLSDPDLTFGITDYSLYFGMELLPVTKSITLKFRYES